MPLLCFFDIGGRWAVSLKEEQHHLLIFSKIMSRWAVFLAISMPLIVEGQSTKVDGHVGSRLSSSSWLDAIGEAVLWKLGVQLSQIWRLWMLKMASWHSGGPMWSVPLRRPVRFPNEATF
jgi:hypothetical protein